jgi:hypothetical protein
MTEASVAIITGILVFSALRRRAANHAGLGSVMLNSRSQTLGVGAAFFAIGRSIAVHG